MKPKQPAPDPLTNPSPCDGDFQLVCSHYGLTDDERQLASDAFRRNPLDSARTFRAVAEAIRSGGLR